MVGKILAPILKGVIQINLYFYEILSKIQMKGKIFFKNVKKLDFKMTFILEGLSKCLLEQLLLKVNNFWIYKMRLVRTQKFKVSFFPGSEIAVGFMYIYLALLQNQKCSELWVDISHFHNIGATKKHIIKDYQKIPYSKLARWHLLGCIYKKNYLKLYFFLHSSFIKNT